MDTMLQQMLSKYDNKTDYDKRNSMKEIIQEIVLCALSRSGFFQEAAFYGGTALRIFYGLDRFSEDLDFSLKQPNETFTLKKYIPFIEREVNAYGLNFKIEEKEKTAESQIKSAFLKGNTREHMLYFFQEQSNSAIAANEIIKVKLEVDTNPPAGATFENKFRLLPAPYQVNMYDMPSLFAGKLHAVICRGWKSRIKGRDLYDYVFYLSRDTAFNLEHLQYRLLQTGCIEAQQVLTLNDVKSMLQQRFHEIDFEQAKEDVRPFIKNQAALDLWGEEFFCTITENIRCK